MSDMLPLVILYNFYNALTDHIPEAENAIAGIIVIGIIVYIIALIFSKKTSCIVICGWKDFLLVAAPMIIITFIVLFNAFYGNYNDKVIAANNIVANILIILSVIATFAVSIISNLRYNRLPQSVFFIIISIVVKPVIMLIMAGFAVLAIGILGSYKPGKKDERRKTGHRPSENFWFVAIALVILGFLAKFLIGGIIKNPQDFIEYENDEDEDNEKEDDNNDVVDDSDTYVKKNVKKPVVISEKNWLVTLLFCLLIGYFGVHRFYTRKIFTGILMLITVGGLGVWWLIDFILVLTGQFKDKDGNVIRRVKI